MEFHNIDTLIQAILNCVERHIDGRNEIVRGRREAIVAFFHRTAVLSASEMPGIEVLLDDVLAVMELFLVALESAPANQLPAELHDELVHCLNELYTVIPCLGEIDGGEIDSEEFAMKASTTCLNALQSIFDWTEPARLQAYVFARTGEFMEEGLLWKERSQLMDHVLSCAKEINDE